ncbi:DNA polymerase-3 subunit gamma/tau [Sphingomonas jejuensis]|uniref:DNA polymerase III subunit gamma/tau n=1 Tax=Sphingomonas jejuensis TaxID=904715 RepID=A0ABX0XJU9_9SPHN|nr:DNA polymerase III subunit gamma/tau [Sphingomonas jejuensis]NJC33627.1 DNA polymerase-3 subunit gamma/tau [Sphingomonas jejuensis]
MSDSLDLGEPPQPAPSSPYRVLARKYRPRTFAELIGQDAMVQTLGNAIRRDRIAHAFLMTGVRGVGKTSTARLIAKALNCIGPDGQGGPTIDPCGVCEPCRSIAEGRHIDVLEMDAASNTGIDDVREIIEAVRYAAVSARYKVYIVDEVHMLSKAAFNGLLKTLEEPPPHVKFIFATTEVNKVPVTVLSRCQRFDLKRIPHDALVAHFAAVAGAEGVAVERDALSLIARAAEGSARDGLSMLDQAIAHAEGDGGVRAEAVRRMLGLADRGMVRRLLSAILGGEAQAALALLAEQHDYGADPQGILRALMETVHAITLAKHGGADPAAVADERAAVDGWAQQLGHARLHRLWQLLLKGHEEVQRAPVPFQAAEMALLRVIHAAELPDPGELMKRIMAGDMPALPAAGAPPAQADPRPAEPVAAAPTLPGDFPALVALLERGGRHGLAQRLHDDARLVGYAPPALSLAMHRPDSDSFVRDLAAALKAITATAWSITLSDQPGAPSLREQDLERERAARQDVLDTPIVRAALAAFPDAELIDHYHPQERKAAS